MLRRFPVGAEILSGGVHFRVWAPKCQTVDVVLENKTPFSLQPEGNGYFGGVCPEALAKDCYQFRLNGEGLFADPASRFQPEGPHGPSQIVDPSFPWQDYHWPGIDNKSPIILYELHVGTFTPEGTWRSAMEKLSHLMELGITVIEMMPIADFCGGFNWGYDGVNLFAPTHCYGTPEELRAFINEAHQCGIGVILDVVYNHFGPDGNYLAEFSDDYLQVDATEWGNAVNFDGKNSKEVRAYFIANAGYWIEEFHFDGVRFDACQAIHDRHTPHILAEITAEIRKKGGSKATYVIAENEQQTIKLAQAPKAGGYGMDAIWNEDFHHTAFVRLTGHSEAYYSDYAGKAQEFISACKYGFLYQGQWYSWQKIRRGSLSCDLLPSSLVNFLENHDQVANSGGSLRLNHFSQPGALRAMTTLLLLAPQTPLLFQGQEFGSTAPFYYFSEQNEELARPVFEGRIEFISQFSSFDNPEVQRNIPPPHLKETFNRSKLLWEEKEMNRPIFQFFKDLIALRKNDSFFKQLNHIQVDGAVLNENAFLIHYTAGHEKRLLLFNFGIDLYLNPAPEPLLAPPLNTTWDIFWSSEQTKYGGFGNLKIPIFGNWHISGNSALILYPKEL